MQNIGITYGYSFGFLETTASYHLGLIRVCAGPAAMIEENQEKMELEHSDERPEEYVPVALQNNNLQPENDVVVLDNALPKSSLHQNVWLIKKTMLEELKEHREKHPFDTYSRVPAKIKTKKTKKIKKKIKGGKTNVNFTSLKRSASF